MVTPRLGRYGEVLNEKWSSLIKDCAKYYAGKQAKQGFGLLKQKKLSIVVIYENLFFRLYQIPHGHIMVI